MLLRNQICSVIHIPSLIHILSLITYFSGKGTYIYIYITSWYGFPFLYSYSVPNSALAYNSLTRPVEENHGEQGSPDVDASHVNSPDV